jgi:hypothetical protein
VPRPVMIPPQLSEHDTDATDATDAIYRGQWWGTGRPADITHPPIHTSAFRPVAFDLSRCFLRRLRPLQPRTNALIINVVNVAALGRRPTEADDGDYDRLTTARHAFAAAEPICRPKSGSQRQKFCTRIRASDRQQMKVPVCVLFAVDPPCGEQFAARATRNIRDSCGPPRRIG